MTYRSKSAVALAMAFALFPPAAQAETITVNGTGTGTSMSEPMPVSEGVVALKIEAMYDGFDSDDPDTPLSGLKGPCFGAGLIDQGKVSGEGLCRYTDADDEVVLMKWIATGMSAEGRTTGDWEIMGGTGKWASASGGGTFDGGTTTGSYTNNITGEITMN